jgi:hypothetical protein
MMVLVFANIILFSVTSMAIMRAKRIGNQAKSSEDKLQFVLMMGFTWVFGFAESFSAEGATALTYLFYAFNAFSGVFIGLAFGCNCRIIMMWRNMCKRKPTSTSRATSCSSARV